MKKMLLLSSIGGMLLMLPLLLVQGQVSSIVQEDEAVICTMEYLPVCGEIQVMCVTEPCNPVRETYSNACVAEAAGATIIAEGPCEEILPTETDSPEESDELSLDLLVIRAHDLGITKYDTTAAFMPNDFLTREQAAKMLMVTLEQIGTTDRMLKLLPGSCEWTDAALIDPSLKDRVDTSCRKGLFQGSPDRAFMPQAILTDTDMSTVLTRAAQFIPVLQDYLPKFAETKDKLLTRGVFVRQLHAITRIIEDDSTTEDPNPWLEDQVWLDAARTLRENQGLLTYEMTQQKSCFCLTDYTRQMSYSVVSGAVDGDTLIYTDTGTPVSGALQVEVHTVEEAFTIIQEAIDSHAADIEASYDTTYGYPTQITIDQDIMMADEEQYWTFSVVVK